MANTLRIKRGLQANIAGLVLQEGELAVALDTGNVYIGTSSGNRHINPTGGTADTAIKLATARNIGSAPFDGTADISLSQIGALGATATATAATKLATPRNISITGDGTASPIAFDGTANAALALTLATQAGVTAGTYTKLTVNAKGLVTGTANITVSDVGGIGTAASKNTGTAAGNVVVVESNGKIAESLMPSLSITDVFEAESETAMLALSTAQQGDIAVRSDINRSYILRAAPASTLANWVMLRTPENAVLSVAGRTGAIVLAKGDVGLGNVDNTADATKVVASAAKWTTARTMTATGDATSTAVSVDGTANVTIPLVLAASGVAAGTYTKITVDAKGRATVGAQATASDVGLGNVTNLADSARAVGSAATLTTARTIALSGGVTGTATSFNGSANITIPVTAVAAASITGTIDGGTF